MLAPPHAQVNGERISSVGEVVLQDGSADDSRAPVTLELKNRKSFGRVIANGPHFTLYMDVVLPKKEWKISRAEYGIYSHINLDFASVQLTPEATGILGITQADDFTFEKASAVFFLFDRYQPGSKMKSLCGPGLALILTCLQGDEDKFRVESLF